MLDLQEVCVSGHIMLMIIKERMENILLYTRRKLEQVARRKDNFMFTSWVSRVCLIWPSVHSGQNSREMVGLNPPPRDHAIVLSLIPFLKHYSTPGLMRREFSELSRLVSSSCGVSCDRLCADCLCLLPKRRTGTG